MSAFAPPLRQVQVVAHRGSSGAVAEHTYAAYRRAIEEGAHALECDVRLTRDGVLVCVHDRRIDRTSNGRGPVSTLELADLSELDFGSWKTAGGRVEVPDRDSSAVLTLERLLELVVDSDRPIELAVETKHPTRYAGLVEQHLVALLDRFGLAHPRLGGRSPIRVMSSSQLSLRRVRQLAPSLGTVLLMRRVPVRLRDGSLPRGVHVAGPNIEILRAHPRYVERAHQFGNQVHAWTVNRSADVELCLSLGVDALITDRPAEVLARLSY